MIKRVKIGVIVCGCMQIAMGSASASEEEIRNSIRDYVTAFNAKEISKIESAWSENAVYVDQQLGERVEGRANIVRDIASAFEQSPSLKLSGTIDYVRLIRDDVATVVGESVVFDDDLPVKNRFSAILIKQDNGWKIDSMDESAIPTAVASRQSLSKLEWLVGDWQDASGDGAVRATVRFAVGGAFLLRTFETPNANGGVFQSTQIIGWDPRSQQIRSWSFDADGAFGDGIWSHSDGEWLVRSTQTLADGRAASGTYVMIPLDENSFTVQLIGRDIEGEPQPTVPAVTVTRVTSQ